MVSRRLDVVSYLGSQVLFQNMPEAELQRIAAASIVRRLPRGTEIFAAGDTCEGLYLVVDGQLVKWGEGGYLTGKWRSKLFSQPQMTGFACAQVESAPLYDEDNVAVTAPAYPVTTRIYADQRLFYTWTVSASDYYGSEAAKLLAQRNPFRLPPLTGFLGRDWEIELDVTQEIFNVALAQAMAEIAST